MKRLLALVALLLLLPLRAEEPINLWPFYLRENAETHIAWPLIKSAPDELALHPVYWRTATTHRFAYLLSLDFAQREYAFYPFFYSAPDGWLSPLGGTGGIDNRSRWWYALTVGTHRAFTTLPNGVRSERFRNWFLPFWFYTGTETASSLWTPLSYRDRDDTWPLSRVYIGPFGLPWLYFYDRRAADREWRLFTLIYSSHEDYITRPDGTRPEPFAPKRDAFSLAFGLLYHNRHASSLPLDRPLPADLLKDHSRLERPYTFTKHAALLNLAGFSREHYGQDTYAEEWLFPLYFRGEEPHGTSNWTEAWYEPDRRYTSCSPYIRTKRYTPADRDSWLHFPPLWFSWQTGGKAPRTTRLLFPLWCQRVYQSGDARWWFSPFAGAGSDPVNQAKWWFALTAGAAESTPKSGREASCWFLPFYFATETPTRATSWTPLSYTKTEYDRLGENYFSFGPILPIYHRLRSLSEESEGGFLLCNEREWALSAAQTGEKNRVTAEPNIEELSLGGGLLFSKTTLHPLPDACPVDLLDSWLWCFHLSPHRTPRASGYNYSLLLNLVNWSKNQLELQDERSDFNLGWLLWRWEHERDCFGADRRFSLWTPLASYRTSTCQSDDLRNFGRSRRNGFLFDALCWNSYASRTCNDYNFDLAWGTLADYSSSLPAEGYKRKSAPALPFTDAWPEEMSQEFILLRSLLSRTRFARYVSLGDYELGSQSDCWGCDARLREECTRTLLPGGLLYRFSDTACDEVDSPRERLVELRSLVYQFVRRETITRKRTRTLDSSLLWSLLYARHEDWREAWAWPNGQPPAEQPKTREHTATLSCLTPLVYKAESTDPCDESQATYTRRLLLGLLYKEEGNRKTGTEQVNLLGFLFHSRLSADQTRTRALFPFITTTTNASTGAWSFSFFHKLFRVEQTAEGETKWWLFWL